MRNLEHIKGVMWVKHPFTNTDSFLGMKCCIVDLPTGVRGNVIVSENEMGWEHVSIELCARRLPTWEEMCFVKDLFWDDEETVIQMHPKKSQYVDIAEALHLWRPVDGNWNILNVEDED